MRIDGRKPDELRKIKISRNFQKYADGSCLIEFGNTHVICAASIQDSVPPHLVGTGTGWITAEYALLPRAGTKRTPRSKMISSGRTHEIQRLIGRSLRAVVALEKLGEKTIIIDCDVLQADGGTRTASISGAFVALYEALVKLKKNGKIKEIPVRSYVAAVSAGIVNGEILLDLCGKEDNIASVDMNVVMTDRGEFVEIQGTGEESTFSSSELNKILAAAKDSITEIIKIQKNAIKKI